MLFLLALLSFGSASPAPLPNDAATTSTPDCLSVTILPPPPSRTPFCSSYLSLTDKTIYTTSSATQTITVTPSATSTFTSYTFLPGNPPPSPKLRRDIPALAERNTCNRDNCLRNLVDARYVTSAQAFCSTYTATTTSIAVPSYIANCGQPAVPSRLSSACSCAFPTTTAPPNQDPSATSKACSCLGLTTSTVTSTAIADYVTTITASPAVATTTKTVYPCASPLPSPGPAYGLAQGSRPPTDNTLFYLDSPEGNSAAACCNTCFFGVPNCVQAFWYFYEGCVVSQVSGAANGDGQSVSGVCPAGRIQGLTYGPDNGGPFRSTGDIAGPCGQAYTNLS